MYVQLLAIKHVDVDGVQKRRMPGDWVNIGKQTALEWITRGEARVFEPMPLDPGCGVHIVGDVSQGKETINRINNLIPFSTGTLRLDYAKTLIWDPSLPLRIDLISAGFYFLTQWEIAAPMASYVDLAKDIGTEQDRDKTEALIHDLRVPFYDTRLMFIRRCENTERLLELWKSERVGGGDERLAFTRALYQVKPLMMALPVTWVSKE